PSATLTPSGVFAGSVGIGITNPLATSSKLNVSNIMYISNGIVVGPGVACVCDLDNMLKDCENHITIDPIGATCTDQYDVLGVAKWKEYKVGYSNSLVIKNDSEFVGIGITNPSELFHVQGNHDLVNVPPQWYGDDVLFEIGAFIVRDSSPVIKFETTNWLGVEHRNFGITSYSDEKLHIFSENDDGTGKKSRITINGTNGHVGIGTNIPSAQLQIEGDGSGDPGDAEITLRHTGAGGSAGVTFDVDAIPFYIKANDDKLKFGTISGGAKMVIMPGGNVGIGSYNPTQKLEVDGGMRLNTADARPACDVDARGTFWFTQNAVKDVLEICANDTAVGGLAWRQIY
ncbi:MAG: hypothetical protein KAI72_02195, partial [Candidatus Pacebacteria bacterium]|nr:hypothetical protein [Candidatus Paceibacterota bacterium]